MQLIWLLFNIYSVTGFLYSRSILPNSNRALLAEADFPPTTLSPTTKYNTEFNISDTINSTEEVLSIVRSKIDTLGITDIEQHSALKEMAKFISFSIDLDNVELKQMNWHITIRLDQGTLKAFVILVTIENREVNIATKSVTATQIIPAFYETKQSCVRGSRRYGFAGPRKLECTNYTVRRGLTAGEIEYISTRLFNKVKEAF